MAYALELSTHPTASVFCSQHVSICHKVGIIQIGERLISSLPGKFVQDSRSSDLARQGSSLNRVVIHTLIRDAILTLPRPPQLQKYKGLKELMAFQAATSA